MPGAAPVLRPGPTGLGGLVQRTAMAAIPVALRLLRRFRPIARFGRTYVATRYDDVREVFAADGAFAVPYAAKLAVIMGGEPFFLGMRDTPQYRADAAAMRRVVRPDDLPRLAADAEARAARVVAAAGGEIEVVDGLVRTVTFGLLAEYFGIPEPPAGNLKVWATRLFEYQFVSSDAPLVAEVDAIAPALRAHIDGEIARRRSDPSAGADDVLGRCLAMQAAGEPGFSDTQIRTALMGFIVGGPPQPPMVVPQALEQLLRRPAALAAAHRAAATSDDPGLAAMVLEAMRFDPLAPGVPRTVAADHLLAAGTRRARLIPAGSTIIAAFSSAMMDERRVPSPRRFDATRQDYQYLHFGHGLHQCFGLHINRATLHRMLKPLLARPNLRRAPARAGRLAKQGAFAAALTVRFDPV